MKAACDRLLSDEDLASQPTLSRLENSITSKDMYRMANYFLDLYIGKKKKEKPKWFRLASGYPEKRNCFLRRAQHLFMASLLCTSIKMSFQGYKLASLNCGEH